MRPPIWNPPIELPASEQKIALRIRKAKQLGKERNSLPQWYQYTIYHSNTPDSFWNDTTSLRGARIIKKSN